MSLTLEGFNKANIRYNIMIDRINKIVARLELPNGNYINCDHYGNLTLFDYKVNDLTTDEALEKIIKIEMLHEILSHEEKMGLLKELMLEAIDTKRPDQIQDFCLEIWNQPFFYKIDKAKALTISYNPTDKGARTNYPDLLERHKQNPLSSEEIYNLLYNFKKESHFRKNYDLLFSQLSISSDEIAHMDVSSFPYKKLKYLYEFESNNYNSRFMLQAIKLLSNQLKYILIDGKENKSIVTYYLQKDYFLLSSKSLPINKSEIPYELSIYKHKQKDLHLIYYACALFGQTRPNNLHVQKIIQHIKDNC